MAGTCRLTRGKQGHCCCHRMAWSLECLTFPVSCCTPMLSSLLAVFKIEKWNALAEKRPFPLFLKVFFIFNERFFCCWCHLWGEWIHLFCQGVN